MNHHLSLEHVSFSYPFFRRDRERSRFPFRGVHVSKEVLHDVSLDIPHGSRVAIIGPNGSGKTTLLRVMAGIFKPDSGKVHVTGSIGTFFDSGFGLDFERSGRENVVTRGLLQGRYGQDFIHGIHEVGRFSELATAFDDPIRTYSTGMVSRLTLGLAMTWTSSILLIDEGLATADRSFQEKVERKLSEILGGASIVVVSTHSLNTALALANQAIVVQPSRVSGLMNLDAALGIYPLA